MQEIILFALEAGNCWCQEEGKKKRAPERKRSCSTYCLHLQSTACRLSGRDYWISVEVCMCLCAFLIIMQIHTSGELQFTDRLQWQFHGTLVGFERHKQRG